MSDAITLAVTVATALFSVAVLLLIGRLADRAKAKAHAAIYERPYHEREADAAKILMACLSLDRYAPESEMHAAFYLDRRHFPTVPAFTLHMPGDEIHTFHESVTSTVLKLLAPDTSPTDYRAVEPAVASQRSTHSINPHDLSQEDLMRIARTFHLFPPKDSQLFEVLVAPRKRFQPKNVTMLRRPA